MKRRSVHRPSAANKLLPAVALALILGGGPVLAQNSDTRAKPESAPEKTSAPVAASPTKTPAPTSAAASGAEQPTEPSMEQLYDAGKALFDQYAPPEIKEQYEFPSKEQWDEFSQRLQNALDNDNLAELAQYLPEARTALTALRTFPGYEDYADWLEERIDYIEAAKEATTAAPPKPVTPPAPGERPTPSTPKVDVPYYDLWLRRIQEKPAPAGAGKIMPALQSAFIAEGIPPELAWIAETESSLNPTARSPAGAKGLFQLMPDTARNLGLSTFLPDERTDADKSAHAAAKYLRQLHEKFGDWPLAFAAYNAGEGRVQRLLKQKNATTFAGIAGSLRSETRMYVPKVCATIAVRAGVPVTALEPAG